MTFLEQWYFHYREFLHVTVKQWGFCTGLQIYPGIMPGTIMLQFYPFGPEIPDRLRVQEFSSFAILEVKSGDFTTFWSLYHILVFYHWDHVLTTGTMFYPPGMFCQN